MAATYNLSLIFVYVYARGCPISLHAYGWHKKIHITYIITEMWLFSVFVFSQLSADLYAAVLREALLLWLESRKCDAAPCHLTIC